MTWTGFGHVKLGRGDGDLAPLPDGQHRLRVALQHPDGFEQTWTSLNAGEAAEGHERLADRWKEARYEFTRDKKTLTLTQTRPGYADRPDLIEIVTHLPLDEHAEPAHITDEQPDEQAIEPINYDLFGEPA